MSLHARSLARLAALVALALVADVPRLAAADDAAAQPLSLTASDGTGLGLVALDARAVVDDPLAFTELRLEFENPQDRVLEGQFRITLPRGASVSRFAMKTDAGWQEGEVVELQAARRAYEDFLHRRQDPALLEQAAGNEFSARVFPIPARGRKELIISYSQELVGASEPYVLALAGLPRLGRLDVRVVDETRSPAKVTEAHEQALVPRKDFEVVPARADGVVGLREGDLALVRVRPVQGTQADPLRSLAVLLDTSASRGLGLASSIELVQALAAAVRQHGGARAPFLVATFDQTAEVAYEGTASGFDAQAAAKLAARGALGASNLELALGRLASHLAKGQARGRYGRLVVVSDGVVTAGADDGATLAAATKALGGSGIERVDAVAVGGIRDEGTLGRLVTATVARDGAVLDGKLPASVIADRLSRATRSGLVVQAEGASWVWPERLDGVQAGDDILIFASIPAGKPVRLRIGQLAVAPDGSALARAEPALLARAAARARLQKLGAERDSLAPSDAEKREALRREIVALSTTQRVLCPLTALLVLETEQDYARFGIDRRALADILTVDERGIAVVDRRTSAQPPKVAATPRREIERAAERRAAPGRADGLADVGASASGAGGPPATGAVESGAALDQMPAPLEAAAAPSAPSAGADEAKAMEAPAPVAGRLARAAEPPAPPPASAPAPMRRERASEIEAAEQRADRPRDGADEDDRTPAYSGSFAEIMKLLARGGVGAARQKALAWHEQSPGDVLALVALGEVYEKAGDVASAARAYGSLIDLFPNRADLRRFAGERLDRLRGPDALALAVDTYRKAAAQRPDHPASHRLLGFALLRSGDPAAAFDAIAAGLRRDYPDGRFAGAHDILAEDLGLVAAAWTRAEPAKARDIARRLAEAGGRAEADPSLRFVLVWETDANDVDFHIYDAKGNHAYFSQMELASGGRLYADVTTGYGPECFTIRGKPRAYPYRLQAHYYSRGPMGYGMGKLEVIAHDGRGGLRFEERPFVVMQDGAFVDLGTVSQ